MRRFELGMTLNYASSWGVAEGVREFFQNALDEEKENPENVATFNYDAGKGIITISNAKSKLTPKTLLMGSTSKSGNSELIGEHGEGYKVATVVLVRNGVQVNIYNNESNEVWESRVIHSKRYDTDIVCFDIRKDIFNKEDNLVIELVGITPEMFSDIQRKNLWLQGDLGEVKKGDCGTLLLDPKYEGDIYVEGLYICNKPILSWGYNLNANMIKLDRDRSLVDGFDLQFTVAEVIAKLHDPQFIIDNLHAPDMRYISCYKGYVDNKVASAEKDASSKDLSDWALERFYEAHGADSVPVANSDDFNYYSSIGANPVMVESQEADLIFSKERKFKSYDGMSNEELKEQLKSWFEDNKYMLTGTMISKFSLLLDEVLKRL